MSNPARPYVARCRYCHEGLLRLMQCQGCSQVVAVCDECELLWFNVAAVARRSDRTAAGSFPNCPHCEEPTSWTMLSDEEIEQLGLSHYVAGRSA